MPFLGFGRKKSIKNDKIAPELPQQFQSEPTSNTLKEVWWIFAILIAFLLAIVAVAHWDKIAPILDKIASIIPH